MTEDSRRTPRSGAEAIAGLLLAAGAGRRMGQPKALVLGADGVAWVVRSAQLLQAAGCSPVVVVVGAHAAEVEAVLANRFGPGELVIVYVADWGSGMAASFRAGLLAAESTSAAGVIVSLVDLPDLRVEAVERVLGQATDRDQAASRLLRAVYNGRPGHPVFIGRKHWSALSAEVRGDAGANTYLREHDAESVDCSDLGSGEDRDFAP
jgi:CTP:molybdopterin cytidylyltransferase MocA